MELKTKQQIQGCGFREIMKSLKVPQNENYECQAMSLHDKSKFLVLCSFITYMFLLKHSHVYQENTTDLSGIFQSIPIKSIA